jgi:predicted RNase H-like nuclease
MRFLGVDLAWKDGSGSGVALLGGRAFPLHLRETPHVLGTHEAVLGWIARHVHAHRAAVGIDAPLLGLETPGHRVAEREIGQMFQRYDAPAFPPPNYPDLRTFVQQLRAYWSLDAFGPGFTPTSGNPAIREVYPNAFQVGLFKLDSAPGQIIMKYKRKRHRFRRKAEWAEEGLGPFVGRCAAAAGGRYVVTSDAAWKALVADEPRAGLSGRQLKSIEDRWDALLCALAVALEFFEPGSMRYYPDEPGAWRRGFILAPALPGRALSP